MKEKQDLGNLSADKHEQILRGALSVFIELGFERASVDLIADRAGVSKATVYKHFQDKRALFTDCVLEQCRRIETAVNEVLSERTGDLEHDLRTLGERVVRYFVSSEATAFHRAIIPEMLRFPDLGRIILERGVTRVQQGLAPFFKEWQDRGELEIEDPCLVASQFLMLCRSDLLIRVELGIIQTASDEEIRTAVDRAVKLLVRAYRPRES